MKRKCKIRNNRYISISAATFDRLRKVGKEYGFTPAECVREILEDSLPADRNTETSERGK